MPHRLASLAHGAMRPIMWIWYSSVQEAWETVPRPTDAPRAFLPGLEVDRILLVGGHTAAGFGLVTHQLGLVGGLSRQLAAFTGRGVELEACADIGMTLHALLRAVRELPAMRPDVVLVTVGINDALKLTPVRSWKRDLVILVGRLREIALAEVEIVICAIPCARMVWNFARLPAHIASRHADLLNAASTAVCKNLPSVRFFVYDSATFGTEPDLNRWRAANYRNGREHCFSWSSPR